MLSCPLAAFPVRRRSAPGDKVATRHGWRRAFRQLDTPVATDPPTNRDRTVTRGVVRRTKAPTPDPERSTWSWRWPGDGDDRRPPSGPLPIVLLAAGLAGCTGGNPAGKPAASRSAPGTTGPSSAATA